MSSELVLDRRTYNIVRSRPAESEEKGLSCHVTFKRYPVSVDFILANDGLSEQIDLGSTWVRAIYVPDSPHGNLQLVAIRLEDNEGHVREFSVADIAFENEYTAPLGSHSVSVFISHPELDRKTRYSDIHSDAAAEYQNAGHHHLVVHLDGQRMGATFPLRLGALPNVQGQMEDGFLPLEWQLIVIPNRMFLGPDDVGMAPAAIPLVIGALYEKIILEKVRRTAKENHESYFFVGVSQIFGHGIRMLDHAKTIWDRGLGDSYRFFIVPTQNIYSKFLSLHKQGLPEALVGLWAYGREEGYGADKLPLNPEDMRASKTALALFSQNPDLVVTLLSHPRIMLYTESKQDVVFFNLLAFVMDLDLLPFARVHTVLEPEVAPEKLSGSLRDIALRANQALGDARLVLDSLGLEGFPPANGIDFWWQKIRACFNGFALYMTTRSDIDYIINAVNRLDQLKTRIIPIPHIAPRALKSQLTKTEAVEHVLKEIQKLALPDVNHAETILREPSARVIVLEMSTSPYVFREETLQLFARISESLMDKNFLFLVAVESLQSLNACLQKESLTKPSNLVPVGFRTDIDAFIQAADLYVCRGGNLGTLFRVRNFNTPILLLPPDTLIASQEEKLEEIRKDGPGAAIELGQVAIETNRERTRVFFDAIERLSSAGVEEPELCVLDVATLLTAQQAVEIINYGLQHSDEIVQGLKSIPVTHMDQLIEVLEELRVSKIDLDQLESRAARWFVEA